VVFAKARAIRATSAVNTPASPRPGSGCRGRRPSRARRSLDMPCGSSRHRPPSPRRTPTWNVGS